MMKVDPMTAEATYLRRLNRFSCLVNIGDEREIVYLPNSGRLENILVPGHTIFLVEKSHSSRRTRYDLTMAYVGKDIVSVDSRVPAELFDEAIREKRLPQFDGYSVVRREAAFCRSRLDFLLGGQNRQGYVEVKSVTLVEGSKALFPDAPTERGRRHLEDLMRARREGFDAAVVFIVQRQDAQSFSPNDGVDPAFARTLRDASRQGVRVYCYGCRVTLEKIDISGELAVCM
jgi:sugar fermentation stimulation protein A